MPQIRYKIKHAQYRANWNVQCSIFKSTNNVNITHFLATQIRVMIVAVI